MWIRFVVLACFTIFIFISSAQISSQLVHDDGISSQTTAFASSINDQAFHDASKTSESLHSTSGEHLSIASSQTFSPSSQSSSSSQSLSSSSSSSASSNKVEKQQSTIVDEHLTNLQIDETLEEEQESIVESVDSTVVNNPKHNQQQQQQPPQDTEVFDANMNVKDAPSGDTINNENLFVLLYEYSLGFLTHMGNTLGDVFVKNNISANINDQNDNLTIVYRIETLSAICAFIVCLIVFYICRSRNSSKCSKFLRYFDILSLLSSFINYIGSFFKFLVKTPENIEIHINSDNAGAYSMQGRRDGMEDRFTLKNSISNDFGIDYYAVYDGHGGSNAAAYAERDLFSRITRRIKVLITEYSKENTSSKVKARTPLKEVKNLLTRIVPDASRFDCLNVNELKNILNDEIISFDEKLVDEFTKKQDISGTTALIVIRIVKTNTLLVANVGDSRAILCDWKNATIPLSFDHKPDKLKEYRRVMEAGGCIILRGVFRVNGILAVSRALGDYPLKNNRIVIPDPDILTFDLDDLRPRFMIIASDGFWDTFSNENAVHFVRNELTHYGTNYVAKGSGSLAVQLAKKLAQESYNRESYDNITVIVVLFEELDGIIKSRVGMAKKMK